MKGNHEDTKEVVALYSETQRLEAMVIECRKVKTKAENLKGFYEGLKALKPQGAPTPLIDAKLEVLEAILS